VPASVPHDRTPRLSSIISPMPLEVHHTNVPKYYKHDFYGQAFPTCPFNVNSLAVQPFGHALPRFLLFNQVVVLSECEPLSRALPFLNHATSAASGFGFNCVPSCVASLFSSLSLSHSFRFCASYVCQTRPHLRSTCGRLRGAKLRIM